jgi:cystathionine beta-lyase
MSEKYNFDQIIDRRNTNSLKYDFGMERKGRDDLLPLWVADMDFQLPGEVTDGLLSCARHGIFGYTDTKEDYYEALCSWFLKKHGWKIKREWNTITPGVVYAIAATIRAFTGEGDAVIIQQPVYYPFRECIVDNRRRCINSQLLYEDGKYRMDLEDFERKIIENDVKLYILCSPHNPVGRVWTRQELQAVGAICLRHGVLVVADEIHCDFTYPGHEHVPFASISESFARNTIVCTSPSKTFNVAGLQNANILIPDEKIRQSFQKENAAAGYSQGTTFGIAAGRLVYEKGSAWYEQLKEYLKGNLDFARSFLEENIPQIKLVEPEGTYLIWLDCTGLGLDYKELETLIVDKAKLWLDAGRVFGGETSLFERVNIACPRSILHKALLQLKQAVDTRNQGRGEQSWSTV